MIDTASVNFAIGKLSETWQKAAPSIQNVSEEYMKFVVAKTVLQVPFAILFTLVFAAVVIYGYRIGKRLEEYDHPACASLLVFGGLGFIISMSLSVLFSYDAALALWCPQMFVINQIIGAVK